MSSLVPRLPTPRGTDSGLWAAHDVEYYRSGIQPFRHPLAATQP